jgi:hypothetical protein
VASPDGLRTSRKMWRFIEEQITSVASDDPV